MSLKPLSIADIKVGEPLRKAVYDRQGVLLLREGVQINSESQLHGLLARGFVREQADSSRDRPLPLEDNREHDTLFAGIRALGVVLRRIHADLRNGHGGDVAARVRPIVVGMQAALQVDSDATLAAMQIDAAENGFVERHLHAAALCELVGRALDLPVEQRQQLACAALTYDVGFADLHEVLDAQAGPLSDEQRQELHKHPLRSVEMLKQAGVADACWLDTVLQHHERLDGSGYPYGKTGAAICRTARMLSISDVYTAMIRPRAYRGALQTRIALRDIFLERGRQVDEGLAAAFVKELGIYPPGTFVRLRNGEIAVVTRRRQNAAHPALKCVVGKEGVPLARPSPRDSQETDSAIIEIVSVQAYRCVLGSIERLWLVRETLASADP